MQRRASLSISTNAIVVLIIAVIMLGLIIGLVTRAFNSVEQKFFNSIDSNEPNPPAPSQGTPITLSRTAESGSRGDYIGMKIGILDNTPSTTITGAYPAIECKNDPASGTNPIADKSQQYFSKTLKPGDSNVFTYVFMINKNAVSSTYLCRIVAMGVTGGGSTPQAISEISPAEFSLTVNQ